MRKIYLVVAPLLFLFATLLSVLCKVKDLSESIHSLSIFLWFLFCVFSYFCIFLKGTLKKSYLSIPIYVSIVLMFAGLILRIQHWPYAHLLILTGGIGIAVFYIIHFLLKPQKHLLDWMKMIYISVATVRCALAFINMPEERQLSWVSFGVGIILAAVFYWNEWRNINVDHQKQLEIGNSGENLFVYNDEV